jgi:hypothetical protein
MKLGCGVKGAPAPATSQMAEKFSKVLAVNGVREAKNDKPSSPCLIVNVNPDKMPHRKKGNLSKQVPFRIIKHQNIGTLFI